MVKYPHMKPGIETRVWDSFRVKFGDRYSALKYDVHVGEGQYITKGVRLSVTKGFQRLTQKRIDVLGLTGTGADIIEVKDRGSWTALGQLVGYKRMWEKEHTGVPVEGLVLVCASCDDDVKECLEAQGVEVFILG